MNFHQEDDRDTSDEEDIEEISLPESSDPRPNSSQPLLRQDEPDDPAFVKFERLRPPPRPLTLAQKRNRVPVTRARATPLEKEKAEIRFRQPLPKDSDLPSPQRFLLTITAAESSITGRGPMSRTTTWDLLGSQALRSRYAKMQLQRSMQAELNELRDRVKQLRYLRIIARKAPQFSPHIDFERQLQTEYTTLKAHVNTLTLTSNIDSGKLNEINNFFSSYLSQKEEQKRRVDALEAAMKPWLEHYRQNRLKNLEDELRACKASINQQFDRINAIQDTPYNKELNALIDKLNQHQKEIDTARSHHKTSLREWELDTLHERMKEISRDLDQTTNAQLQKLEVDTARYKLQRLRKITEQQWEELTGLTQPTIDENRELYAVIADSLEVALEQSKAKMSSSHLESMRECIEGMEDLNRINGQDISRLCTADEPRKLPIQLATEYLILDGMLGTLKDLHVIRASDEVTHLRTFIRTRLKEIAEMRSSLSNRQAGNQLQSEEIRDLKRLIETTSTIRAKDLTTKVEWLQTLEQRESRHYVHAVLENNAAILVELQARIDRLRISKQRTPEQIADLNSALFHHRSKINSLKREVAASSLTTARLSDIKKQTITLRHEQNHRIRPAIAVLAWREELEECKKRFLQASPENLRQAFEELKRCIYSPALIQEGRVQDGLPTNAPYQEASAVNAEKLKVQKAHAEQRAVIKLLNVAWVKTEIIRRFGKYKEPTTKIPSGEVIVEPFANVGKGAVLCEIPGARDNFIALTRTMALEQTTLSSDAFDKACEIAKANKNRKVGDPAQRLRFTLRTTEEIGSRQNANQSRKRL